MLFHIDPLRLWVHKVLPVVYDDSLSYYEVLAKVTKKLNEVIDLTEEQNQYIEEFSTNLTNAINHWEDGMEQEWSSYKSGLNNEWGAFQRNTEQYIENWKNMAESDIEDAIAAGINQFVSYFSDLTQTAVDAAERAMEAAETAAQDAVEAVLPTLENQFDERYAWKTAVGSPLVATTAAGMTDTTKVYVYAGSETGYVNGDWYYYDGTAWQDGGVYNSAAVVTDDTLSEAGVPADAKAAGDAIGELKSASIIAKPINVIWKSGGYTQDGSYSTSSNVIRSDRFTADKYISINILAGYEAYIAAWNGDTYIGKYATNNQFETDNTTYPIQWITSFDFTAFPNYSFSVVMRNTSSSTIDVSVAENCIFSMTRFYPDKTLTVSGVPADAKITGNINYYEINNNIWVSGHINYTNGAITANASRRRSSISFDSSVICAIKCYSTKVSIYIAAWNNTGFVGMYQRNGTFAKENDTAWIKEFNFTEYPEYSFIVCLASSDDTFDYENIKLYSTIDRIETVNVNGFNSFGGWSKGGVNANPDGTPLIGSQPTRQHLFIKDLSLIEKITYADGYNGYAKAVDENNHILPQINGYLANTYIPAEYQRTDYGIYIVLVKNPDTAHISETEAANATKIHLKNITKTPIITKEYSYYGDKISLNQHRFAVQQGITINNISGYHKQGCASYGNLLVELYNPSLAQLINIQTGDIINTFNTTTGHGASAQFSDEFLNVDDEYPLLYVSPEMDDSDNDVNYIQVIHVTDSSWEVVRTVPCPYRSFVAIDNDSKKMIVLTSDKTISGWPKYINIYDMIRPSIDGTTYTYPLINTIPISGYGVQQCIVFHQGLLFFLNSASTTDRPPTCICVLDPYTGNIKNLIKDLPSYLTGVTATSECEGMTIYYNQRYEKYMLMIISASATSWLIDFDIEQ